LTFRVKFALLVPGAQLDAGYAFDSTMGLPQAAVDSLYSTAYRGLAKVGLTRIDGSYHFIMLDQPEAFLREGDAFLK
jgi:pimeloyl-ACP methyl ester carboxylesterase